MSVIFVHIIDKYVNRSDRYCTELYQILYWNIYVMFFVTEIKFNLFNLNKLRTVCSICMACSAIYMVYLGYSGHVLYCNNINKYLIFSLHSPYKLLSLTDILCHKISLSLWSLSVPLFLGLPFAIMRCLFSSFWRRLFI